MDSSSIVDVHSGVTSIIHEFRQASELLQKWRKGGAGKKAVGQEECEVSFDTGKSTIEETLNRFSRQCGARFDRGDRKCLDTLIDIRKRFHEAVVDVLTRYVAGKLSKVERTSPLELRQISEATRKATVVAMDELSQRIISGTAGPYTMTDPGDVLPHMPLRPMRPPRPPRSSGASASSSQTSLTGISQTGNSDSSQTQFPNPQASQTSSTTTLPESTNSSQASLGTPFAPTPLRNNVYMSTSSWKPPDFGDSQVLARTRPSSSATALSWMKDILPIKPTRPYHDITPLRPTPAVLPTFKCDIDAMDILEEGRRAAEKLWDAAECVENDRLRLQAHSAPIPHGPWKRIFGDDDEEKESQSQTPLPQKRDATSSSSDENHSQMFLSPVFPGTGPLPAQTGRRIRSESMLEFSVPTPRFRRHVSGPENTRAD